MQPKNNITWSQLIKCDTRREPGVCTGDNNGPKGEKRETKSTNAANTEQLLTLAVSSEDIISVTHI